MFCCEEARLKRLVQFLSEAPLTGELQSGCCVWYGSDQCMALNSKALWCIGLLLRHSMSDYNIVGSSPTRVGYVIVSLFIGYIIPLKGDHGPVTDGESRCHKPGVRPCLNNSLNVAESPTRGRTTVNWLCHLLWLNHVEWMYAQLNLAPVTAVSS